MRSVWAKLVGTSLALIGLAIFYQLGNVRQTLSIKPAYASNRSSSTVYLPLVLNNYIAPLCRFGIDGGQNINTYAVSPLRISWYVDWDASLNPVHPNNITYLPMVRLKQVGNTYAIKNLASGAALTATVLANPGSLWLIGNEPDHGYPQDNLVPAVYAQAYHDLYYRIKQLDPSARIAAGGIVQPTPLRLQYLDMVLQNYHANYTDTVSMPVDVWNIHNFILREESGSWGADIPPGINATSGMLYDIQDNDNLAIFEQNLIAFRQWMANNGYQNRPLIITEFGVQMPDGVPEWGALFTPQRVNTFMNGTFDFLNSTTGVLGYPADGNRLVQRWAWWSLDVTDNGNTNGWLFDPTTKARTVIGDNYAAYTANKFDNGCGW